MSNEFTCTPLSAIKIVDKIQLRPGMYIGDLTETGVYKLIFEVLDNFVINELFPSHQVDVKLDNIQKTCEIIIYGDLYCNDFSPESYPEHILSIIYDGNGYRNPIDNLNNVIVSSLSHFFDIKVFKNGHVYSQHFKNGYPVDKLKLNSPDNKSCTNKISIKFSPNLEVFSDKKIADTEFKYASANIRESINLYSLLNKNKTFNIYEDEKKIETYYSSKGTVGLLNLDNDESNSLITIDAESVIDQWRFEVSLINSINDGNEVKTYFNGKQIKNNSSIEWGFTKAFSKLINEACKNKLENEMDQDFNNKIIMNRTSIVLSFYKTVDFPYTDPKTTVLTNKPLEELVMNITMNQLSNYFASNPERFELIVNRVIENQKDKEKDEINNLRLRLKLK